jgi:hypothetical protein
LRGVLWGYEVLGDIDCDERMNVLCCRKVLLLLVVMA